MSDLEVSLKTTPERENFEVCNVSGETLSVDVSEKQKIDVIFGDSAEINVDVALKYIQSGKDEIDDYVRTSLSDALATKQDLISDLSAIRSGAALGATAVQPEDLAIVATTGSYNDLSNKPSIPTATSDLTNDSGFITGISGSDVTTALGYIPYNLTNPNDYQTSAQVNDVVRTHNTSDSSHSDIRSELAGKQDVLQGPYLIETYVNGTSGYRIWSDGYCEQWGESYFASGTDVSTTISFIKIFKDTDYYPLASLGNRGYHSSIYRFGKNTNNITFRVENDSGAGSTIFNWIVSGYLAQGEY